MGEVTFCTPLRVEQAAVRVGLRRSPVRVVHTGMGPRRTSHRLRLIAGDGPLAVLGVAGGLTRDSHPGDVVVASELRGADELVELGAAPLLATALERAGFRVHVGPLVSQPSLMRQPSRESLAATGAIAVDMETAWLAEPWPERRIAAVRVLTDTPDAPLLRLGILRRGLMALTTLRRVAPIVNDVVGALASLDCDDDPDHDNPDSAANPEVH